MCRTIKILIANWPRTPKFSQLFTGREDSCFWLLTLYVQFLCSNWSKFNRWCSILNLVYFDICSWQSFVSTFDVLTVFSTGCTKWNSAAIRSLLLFMVVCLLGFWLRNTSLVKVGNLISDGIVFVFHLAWCVRGLKVILALLDSFQCISNGKPEYLLYLMFVFCI